MRRPSAVLALKAEHCCPLAPKAFGCTHSALLATPSLYHCCRQPSTSLLVSQ
jgi:hypothetical protein